jgi:serine/threonine protein kinase
MEFQVGETYSGYHFLDILKRSKNGIEFRVKNTLVGRLEALRALPESAQNDQEQTERFLREMRVHAGLLHPNIVTLFNAIELENHLIITTELVEGPTVADKLLLGPLPWAEAAALTRQALSAVAYAHQQRIVHRDISPENIIILPDGVLKLANFALAKGPGSPRLTQVGTAIGNLKYISPEQIKGMGDVDARSDLYALGMVLYEMLCGRPAFDLESHFELMAAQVNQPPVPPNEVNTAVPKELGAVVLKALAKDPAERYQTAAEFDEALVKASEAPRPVQVGPQPQAAAAPALDGDRSTAPHRAETPSPSGSAHEEPAAPPMPATTAAEIQPSMELAGQPGIAATHGNSESVPDAAPIVEAAKPSEPTPCVPPQTVPQTVPAVAPVPAFLAAAADPSLSRQLAHPPRSAMGSFPAAAADPSLSRQQLIIGSAAGACLGVLLVVLWLFVK